MHQPMSALLPLISNGLHQPPPFDEPSRAREIYQWTEHSTPSLNGLGGHGSMAYNHGDELGREALAPRSVHSVRAAIPTSAEVWERRGQSDRNSDPFQGLHNAKAQREIAQRGCLVQG